MQHTDIEVIRKTETRLPTAYGTYTLCYYENNLDQKEHLALVMGNVARANGVLLRIHSECFTGDVLSSRRCDCGHQLQLALKTIAEAQRGIIIYLRQEGRGIGLLQKLLAYNLQDQGLDTVEANLELGHRVDEREYSLAGAILNDLGVKSVRLMTNNPHKLKEISACGIAVEERLPLETPVHEDNFYYLYTKKYKMKHLLTFNNLLSFYPLPDRSLKKQATSETISRFSPTQQKLYLLLQKLFRKADWSSRRILRRPSLHITVSYAQSINGSIALQSKCPLPLSSTAALKMTHRLRARHDAILVGIGTVLTDNPCLTVRLVRGKNPQPVILDTWLKTPLTANIFRHPTHKPLIFCSRTADPEKKKRLEKAGASVQPVSLDKANRLVLEEVINWLNGSDFRSLMVEGGSQVITSFLTTRAVDKLIITVVPRLLGGLNAITAPYNSLPADLPPFVKMTYKRIGEELIITGVLKKPACRK